MNPGICRKLHMGCGESLSRLLLPEVKTTPKPAPPQTTDNPVSMLKRSKRRKPQ
jgi:hypothetical protein